MGRTLGADEVAAKVVRAIYANELYVVTHEEESLPPIRKRFQRIERAIATGRAADSAGPGVASRSID